MEWLVEEDAVADLVEWAVPPTASAHRRYKIIPLIMKPDIDVRFPL